ncbi:MAG TPA: fluoride efflux transporter CrcB [Casimicrobiaceae bacterium]
MVASSSILAVGVGAAVGAWLRWALGLALDPLFPTLPLGTLTANLGGGLVMGFAMELAARHALLGPDARLFVMTGFLGGLTTFSTFSAEMTTLLMRREWLWGTIGIAAHVAGSLLMTVIGILLMRALFAWGSPP